jgi:hypothetical protein
MRLLLGFTTLLISCTSQISTSDDGIVEDGDDPPAEQTATSELTAVLPTTLAVSLDRIEALGMNYVAVTATLRRGTVPVTGAPMALSSSDALAGAFVEMAPGVYRAYALPNQTSGEVKLVVTDGTRTVRKVALNLPGIDPRWGMPEPVPGLVNTPGYEDSAEVSPDGEWLLVSDYSPVDMVCCIFGTCGATPTTQVNPAAPQCNTSLGPIAAPARPHLPGLERITSLTSIHDEAPSIGYDLPDGVDLPVALPPISGYGFHRQPDGSFAQPFVIAFAVNGVSTPFGYTFAKPVSGTTATLAFAYEDLRNVRGDYGPATQNDLFHDVIRLGVDNNLGTFSVDASGRPVTDRFPAAVPLPSRAGQQGNPSVSNDGIWFDSEEDRDDLLFAAGDALATAPLASPVTVALSRPDRKETQPYVHANRLYFAADQTTIRSAARAPGGNPALATTWSVERVELSAEATTRVGAVIAIGEPSLAVRNGIESLYFIYVVKTAAGLDLNVGRVQAR